MNTFVDRVRRGEIAQPTQRAFSSERWQIAFEETPEPSDADAKLYRAGVCAFKKLEATRRKRASLWLRDLSKEELLMYVGIASRDCQLIVAASSPVEDKSFVVVEQTVDESQRSWAAHAFGSLSTPS
jgi:hypothetical protein